MRNDARARSHAAYWAFLVHRISGVLLTLFLPAHFWVLGQALRGEAALDGVLRWSDQPLVKVGEVVLIALLAAHLTGGVRILMLEFLPWREWQKALAAGGAGLTLVITLAFLFNLL